MKMLSSLLILFIAVTPEIAIAQTQSSSFEPTGPRAYDVPARDRVANLSLMEQRRRDETAANQPSGSGSGSGGTIAVGNWQQIYLTIGDNSSGAIHNSSPQLDWGTQTATSNVNSQNSAADQTVRNGSDWNCMGCSGNSPQAWRWGKKQAAPDRSADVIAGDKNAVVQKAP